MVYGLPYKGSKNIIANRIVDALPSGTNFVDCCCGGGAIPGKPFPVNRSLFLFQCLSFCLEGGSVVHRLGLQDVDLHARVGHVDEVRHLRRSDDQPVGVLNHAHFDEHVLDSLRGVVRIAPDGVTVVDADGQPGRLEWSSGAPVKRNDGLRVFLPLPIPFGRKEE